MMRSAVASLALIPLLAYAQLVELEGQWVEGNMIVGQTESGARVEFKGQPVMVADDGLFVIGLHRDENEPVTLRVQSADGGTEESMQFAVEQRDYDIQRIEGIARNIMEPSAQEQGRIYADWLMTQEARKVRSSDREFLASFDWPVRGPISGVYGSQRVYNGVPGTPHYGLDIAVPTGTPVKAPAAGRVILVSPDMFYSGGTVVLDHGHGVSSSFLHMSKVLVEKGQWIEQGELIGEVGATGRVTGPHLDWRMNWGDSRIDPEFFLRRSGVWHLD